MADDSDKQREANTGLTRQDERTVDNPSRTPSVRPPRRSGADVTGGAEPASNTAEPVNHPEHYGGADNPYEAIKVVEAWSLDFCLGNVVKYISRAGKKGDMLEDLKKARWYLNREIANLEKAKAE